MSGHGHDPLAIEPGDLVRVTAAGCPDGWAVEIVERAPEPVIPVGSTGTVTLPNRAEYPAIRYDDGYAYVDEHGNVHIAVDEVDDVAFVADPGPGLEPLTAEAVGRIVDEVFPYTNGQRPHAAPAALYEALARYVAKDGA